MDSYATIKTLTNDIDPPTIETIVNRAENDELGACVHRRIDASCRRFPGFGVAAAGIVPESENIVDTAQAGVPLLVASPTCEAAWAIDRMAAALAVETESQTPASPIAA